VAGFATLWCIAFALVCSANIPSKALTGGPFWTDPSTGLAIGGFDPVSYFTDGAAMRGDEIYELVWSDVAWRFANSGNRDEFERHPETYAPRFGGFDAMAMTNGQWSEGNPSIWATVDGRLYLFYSTARRDAWLVDPQARIVEAEIQWMSAHRGPNKLSTSAQ
jgi:hypothetical protein